MSAQARYSLRKPSVLTGTARTARPGYKRLPTPVPVLGPYGLVNGRYGPFPSQEDYINVALSNATGWDHLNTNLQIQKMKGGSFSDRRRQRGQPIPARITTLIDHGLDLELKTNSPATQTTGVTEVAPVIPAVPVKTLKDRAMSRKARHHRPAFRRDTSNDIDCGDHLLIYLPSIAPVNRAQFRGSGLLLDGSVPELEKQKPGLRLRGRSPGQELTHRVCKKLRTPGGTRFTGLFNEIGEVAVSSSSFEPDGKKVTVPDVNSGSSSGKSVNLSTTDHASEDCPLQGTIPDVVSPLDGPLRHLSVKDNVDGTKAYSGKSGNNIFTPIRLSKKGKGRAQGLLSPLGSSADGSRKRKSPSPDYAKKISASEICTPEPKLRKISRTFGRQYIAKNDMVSTSTDNIAMYDAASSESD